ncbi:hypothetical protein [Rhodopseudomonas palustris]|uniref:hypothetical protein n=1 Tax=Rhodopseudomonas palustris TaxID=1076 RepID=UPI000E5B409A|nr:hypothetical protein [Rhodopseudomonas palustris]QLH73470.1 hypothetical protein HZF03_22770 [Rhodopseudomonas palustris]RIA02877.1 hypothetical protein D1920_05295 [Rhodopseudomonas palustris]
MEVELLKDRPKVRISEMDPTQPEARLFNALATWTMVWGVVGGTVWLFETALSSLDLPRAAVALLVYAAIPVSFLSLMYFWPRYPSIFEAAMRLRYFAILALAAWLGAYVSNMRFSTSYEGRLVEKTVDTCKRIPQCREAARIW